MPGSNRCTVDQTYNDDMLEEIFANVGVVYEAVGASFTHTEMFCMVRLMPVADQIEINLVKKQIE